jgi:signal transduction histidine kinase
VGDRDRRPRLGALDDDRALVRVSARAALVLAASALAYWVTTSLAVATGGTFFFAAFPIILGAALAGGTAAGLGTVALLGAAFTWTFFHPATSRAAQDIQLIRVVGFSFASGLVAAVAGALRGAYRRTARMHRDAEATAAELRRLQELRDDLVRALTHDVRTPLSTIVNHAELLRRGPEASAPDVARRAEAIRTSAERIASMVSRLLETFQLESGQISLHRERVDLAALGRELTLRLEGSLPVERVRWSVSPAAPAVEADPERLERILVNLLSNALKYSPADAPVTVATEPAGDGVAITVSDGGPGIPSGEAAQVFRRFYRGAQARTADAQGLGLGLHIARLLVEAHGGRISLESSGAGTTFRVVLPAPAQPAAARAEDAPVAPVAAPD